MNWKEAADCINKEAEAVRFTPEKEIIRLYKHQIVPSGMGTGGQAFSTMVFAQGDLRCLNSYGVLCMARLVDDPSFSLEQMKIMFREFVPLSAEFLYTCGLEKVWTFSKMAMDALDTCETKADFKELIDSLAFYLSVLNGWSLIMFPWYIGELFPHKKAEDVKEAVEMLGIQ
jgi:hypothetical protein